LPSFYCIKNSVTAKEQVGWLIKKRKDRKGKPGDKPVSNASEGIPKMCPGEVTIMPRLRVFKRKR